MQNDNPGNPSEYLYNKSTIGGIDQSKLEYKESLKEKIYVSKPSHMYSWVILFVLVFFMIIGGVLYFVYPDLIKGLGTNSEKLAETNNKIQEQTNLEQKLKEEKSLRERYLEIKTPLSLDNDEIINKLKSLNLNTPQDTLKSIISAETLMNITLEFSNVAQIYQGNKEESVNTTPSTPAPTVSDNNIYRNDKNKFSFTLPDNYKYLSEEEQNGVSLIYFGSKDSQNNDALLTIRMNGNVDYKFLEKCNGENENTCLDNGKAWGQTTEIAKFNLGGIEAESFYLSEEKNTWYHVVQTTKQPIISLSMYVADGGSDNDFSQILSSFKFD